MGTDPAELSWGKEEIEVFEGIGHLGSEVALEVGDDTFDPAGEKSEATAEATDEEGIETVET